MPSHKSTVYYAPDFLPGPDFRRRNTHPEKVYRVLLGAWPHGRDAHELGAAVHLNKKQVKAALPWLKTTNTVIGILSDKKTNRNAVRQSFLRLIAQGAYSEATRLFNWYTSIDGVEDEKYTLTRLILNSLDGTHIRISRANGEELAKKTASMLSVMFDTYDFDVTVAHEGHSFSVTEGCKVILLDQYRRQKAAQLRRGTPDEQVLASLLVLSEMRVPPQ